MQRDGIEASETKRDSTTEIQLLRRLVEMAPSDKELRLRLAQALAHSGNYQDALDELRAVIRLDPNNLPARELRLTVRERAGRQQAEI